MWAGIFILKSLLKNIPLFKSMIIKDWQLPMSKCFCKRLWFSLLLQHCFLLCFSWSTSPNYPLLQCSCSIFLFLNVIAAFLWLSPLLSSGSHCFHSWYICFCFPHDIAIGSMMHLALLSNRYPQDHQPGQELKTYQDFEL